MIHALTIDVEDYYSVIQRDWLGVDGLPTQQVVRNTSRLLDLLDRHGGVKATCFVLGEVAETFPQLVRDISAAGHEVGVHGYTHRQFFKLTPDQARQELGRAKKCVEDLLGQPVLGHRAPAFSIRPDTGWALEVLAELGFEYDSSVYPISGRRYGWPGFPLDIHEMELSGGTTIVEAPMSVVHVLGKAMPVAGGGYFRHFPYWVTRRAMKRVGRARPAIFYMHPYDIDIEPGPADFERAMGAAVQTTRRFHKLQLRNRGTVEAKLRRLLDEFEFAPLRDVIRSALAS